MEYQTRVVNTAELFGAQEVSDFSILANGKAFSVLIDGLYADKIWSIVREACANAWDGHMKAGRLDRPFIVHVPTRWEPHFFVRDFGCSMEHDFIMKLYTTLFFSSKDQSNDESGCFGKSLCSLASALSFSSRSSARSSSYKNGGCRGRASLGTWGRTASAIISVASPRRLSRSAETANDPS